MGFSYGKAPAAGKVKTFEFPVTSGKSLNYLINSGSIQNDREVCRNKFSGILFFVR
jgi:hypothetical protein